LTSGLSQCSACTAVLFTCVYTADQLQGTNIGHLVGTFIKSVSCRLLSPGWLVRPAASRACCLLNSFSCFPADASRAAAVFSCSLQQQPSAAEPQPALSDQQYHATQQQCKPGCLTTHVKHLLYSLSLEGPSRVPTGSSLEAAATEDRSRLRPWSGTAMLCPPKAAYRSSGEAFNCQELMLAPCRLSASFGTGACPGSETLVIC
jgi:hypothetical protein